MGYAERGAPLHRHTPICGDCGKPVAKNHRAHPNWRGQVPLLGHQPAEKALAPVACPKCGIRFSTRNRLGRVICRADSPPYTGQGRGCGWLLRIEPGPFGSLVADEVMDVKVNPTTGLPDQELIRQGFFRIFENWQKRGLGKLVFDRMNGTVDMNLIDGQYVNHDEREERERQAFLQRMRG